MDNEPKSKITNNYGNRRGMNPNSRKNLIPPVPGEIRNHKGRPKNQLSLTAALRAMATQEVPDWLLKPAEMGQHLTYAEALAVSIWRAGLQGQPAAWAILYERLEGRVTETIDVTSKGKPIQIMGIEVVNAAQG